MRLPAHGDAAPTRRPHLMAVPALPEECTGYARGAPPLRVSGPTPRATQRGGADTTAPSWDLHGFTTHEANDAARSEAVAAALRSLSCRTDPIHLYSIARELGVSAIKVLDDLDRPGHVAWVNGSPMVQLRAGGDPVRRRFTLSHELAHVILRHGAPETLDRPMTTDLLVSNERMADKVAAALLLPREEIDFLRNLDFITLGHVREVAERQQVSFSVVVNRLRFGDPRPAILLSLTRGHHHWETQRAVGGVNGLTGRIHVLPDQTKLLDQLPRCDVPLALRVRVGAQHHVIDGTGNRHGANVLVLINRVSTVDGAR